MKILLVSSQSHPCAGGLNTYVYLLKEGLSANGHDVDLLSFSDIKRLPEEDQMNILLVSTKLRQNGKNRITLDFGTRLYAFKYLFKLVDISSYDIIHTNCGVSSYAVKHYLNMTPSVGTVHCMLLL